MSDITIKYTSLKKLYTEQNKLKVMQLSNLVQRKITAI